MEKFSVYTCQYGKIVMANSSVGHNQDTVNYAVDSHHHNEVTEMFKIIDSLPEGCVVIDGGANIGSVTIPLAQRIMPKGGKLLSFEAQRRIYYALAGSVALNDLHNVNVYNLALGQEPGVASMPDLTYAETTDFGCVHVSESGPGEYNYLDNNCTQMINIDSLNLPRLDFLKLDIEGYEPQALLGGLETIKKHRPWIWAEYYDCISIYNQDKIKEIVSQVPNYSFYYLTCDRQNMLCVPNEKVDGVNLDFLRSPV